MLTAYIIIQHDLMDLKIFARRLSFLVLIYLTLFILVTPILFPILRTIGQKGSSTLVMPIMGMILVVSGILSLGPLIYSYFVRKNAYFHEHAIAGLTHELKSPLGVIDSATMALIDDLENPTIDRQKIATYLGMIQTNTNRLQGFVHNLIHVAKDQGDDIGLAEEACDLAQLIRRGVDDWQTQATRKNITLHYSGPDVAPIRGDVVKLHQVISNILSNAVKFSSGGEVKIALEKTTDDWICSVSDTGLGLAPAHLKKIFNKFFQARPGSKGTGIGLTIAKTWVEAHGGKIWAESEGEGRGTTMRFTLPV